MNDSSVPAPPAAAFNGCRIVSTYTQNIAAPPGAVFPLLCPIREMEWANGWVARVVFADSGLAEEDGVYAVERPGRDDAIWLVTRRDPAAHEIEFVYVEPGLRAGRLTIAVHPFGSSQSRVDIRYVNTGLSERGNDVVAEAFGREPFERMMIQWEAEMNHYLRTGRMLR